jgi:hypothetical protein
MFPKDGMTDVRSWKAIRGVALLGVAALALALPTPAQASPAPAAASPAAVAGATSSSTLGAYASAIRKTDGTMDVPATIDKLTGAHVNTYWYLVCHFAPYSQAEWDQLPEFLAAAQAAGIKTWVYLCPPSEGHGSPDTVPDLPPYNWDYVRWAQEIANKSIEFPNLVGWTMDDFSSNATNTHWPVRFTPSYTNQMVSAGKAINPNLKFYPIEYYKDLVGLGSTVSQYRTIVDGVIFPYRNDSSGTADNSNSVNMTQESKDTFQTTGCASGGHCYQVAFPGDTTSVANSYAGVQQQVSVTPNQTTYGLTFTYADDYFGTTSGYHHFEITVNGTSVWSEDVAGNRGMRRARADLTSALAGKTTATIGLRVRDLKAVSNFHLAVTFDDLAAEGFTLNDSSFDDPSAWTKVSTSSLFTGGFVNSLPKVDMIYASKLKAAPTEPTAAYVGDCTSRALALTNGTYPYNIGTVEYQLNITGTDTSGAPAAEYATVANIYGAVPAG